MAETLFRQWFVEEADEQWESCTVGEMLSIRGGTTPSTKEASYWDGDIAWTSPRDLAGANGVYLFDTSRKITPLGLAQIGSGLLPPGTVLMSSRAPIGYLAITDIPIAINQGYIAMICDDGIPNYFAYLWCKHHMDDIKAAGNGSTFEEISKSNFKALPFKLPPTEKLEAFDEIATPIFGKLRSNELQIRQLESLRDTLLPKLMSGEVRVSF
ncbi:type I restriction modification DNA specificity protein [Rubrivivax gelatinosus]|uniref:Type I restriction modification DNA specificity protein n=2 Tax=Rubrivivax gelatinosus TaxID=28068 RepID=A0A4R2M294_RUBGE|nr:type I restriction modification DNA specificity protein [Rubrivivax gelatinosus]